MTDVESRRARRRSSSASPRTSASTPIAAVGSFARADALGIVPAPILRRSCAFAIDILCCLLILSPGITAAAILVANANWARPGLAPLTAQSWFLVGFIITLVSGLLGTVYVVVALIVHGRRGATIGKAAAGIRSINVMTLERPGFWRVVLRALVLAASTTVVPVVGGAVVLASPLWRERRIGWLDTVSRSWTIDSRSGLNPYDVKARRRAERRLTRPPRVVESELPSLSTGASSATAFSPTERSRASVVGENPMVKASGVERRDAASGAGANPASTSAPTSVPRTSRPSIMLTGAGVTVVVRRPTLFGRRPEAAPGEEVALAPIADPAFTMSKTHALVGIDSRGTWVEDRGSANGTTIVGAHGSPREVPPFTRAYVERGAAVRFGECAFRVSEQES